MKAAGLPRLTVEEIDSPPGILNQTAPTIDVRLVNSGSGTAVLVGCNVEVVWARRFLHILPPAARRSGGHAALLPPSVHYVALLPAPEEAVGRTFSARKPAPHPLEALRESSARVSHDLESGKADRFLIEVQIEPHGGGTLFDHAMDGDDRLAYQIRLQILYTGGSDVQTLTTAEVGIVSPANTLSVPTADEIRGAIRQFQEEVGEVEAEVNDELVRQGHEPVDWANLRSVLEGADESFSHAASTIDVDAAQVALIDASRLTEAFIKPDAAVRNFLRDLEMFYRYVVTEMPLNSDLAEVFVPPARRALAEIPHIRGEQSR